MSVPIKLSAAVFPVFSDFQKDPEATFKALSEMGFEGIELYGDTIHSAETIRLLSQKYNLAITGAQISWRYFMDEKQLTSLMSYHQIIGNPHLIISALGGPWEAGHKINENTISTWLAHTKRMNEVQEIVARHGFTLDYHTHDYDFAEKIEDKQTSFELIRAHADPQVGIEIDTGSCIKGGQSPQALIQELGQRARLVHCKPVTQEGSFETNIGAADDVNDWEAIISASQHHSAVQWLVVEPENEQSDWHFSMKNGLDYLRNKM
ncbi:sugar phosphate isomerase/epimerase family protein [Lactovum odontotermitis]